MPRCDDLLAKAKNNPKGLRFSELCDLAICLGWIYVRQNDSHRIYKKPGVIGLMDFQEAKNGQAKAYQVRQLLAGLEE